jgi:hypothetical protein
MSKLPIGAQFTINDTDGTSPNTTCQDPVAQNYGSGTSTSCSYATPTGTGVTTSTQFTLFANKQKQPVPNFIFLNWEGAKNTISSGGVSLPMSKTTNQKYLFSLSMVNCPFTNTAKRAGGQIYYGDYVQLTVAGTSGPEYFYPQFGGLNGFSTDAGNCTSSSYQTFQILKVGSDGSLSTANNAAVDMYDEIALVSVSSGSGTGSGGGGATGWVIQALPNNTAGLTGQGLNFLMPQHGKDTKMLPMSADDLMMEYKMNVTDNSILNIIGWIIIAIVIVLLGMYFLKRMKK